MIYSTTQRGLTIEYAYDNNGNRTSVTTPTASTSLRTREDCRAVALAKAGPLASSQIKRPTTAATA